MSGEVLPADGQLAPRLLDLFSGAGGCGMGYHRAGFDVTGVDVDPHPDYPFDFILGDALTVDLEGYDAYHASPPCQGYTTMNNRHGSAYPKLLAEVRERLQATGKPYVIENVPGAKRSMTSPITLSGEMFGLGVHRPRLFESNVLLMLPPKPPRQADPVAVYGKQDGRRLRTRADGSELRVGDLATGSAAMGIDWMNWDDLREAVPPAYTEYIGRQLLLAVDVEGVA